MALFQPTESKQSFLKSLKPANSDIFCSNISQISTYLFFLNNNFRQSNGIISAYGIETEFSKKFEASQQRYIMEQHISEVQVYPILWNKASAENKNS